MSENKNKNTVWTNTIGIAQHLNMNPATIRKQRSKQTKNQLPFHRVAGQIKYNIVECEKHMEKNKYAY